MIFFSIQMVNFNCSTFSNQNEYFVIILRFVITVKPVYNNHPWDPKFVAVVDWWSLFRGSFMIQN